MKEILPEIDRGRRTARRSSSPPSSRRGARRRARSARRLAISESGKMCGSVSGGCVESDVFENAQEVFETGEPKLVSYGIDDDLAWSVGLPVRRRDRRLRRAGRVVGLIHRLAELPRVRGARRPLHCCRRRRRRDEGARPRVGRADRRGARRRGCAVRRADPPRPQPAARARRRLEGVRGVVRPAAAPLRLRRGRHGRGDVPRREAARLAHDRRRRARKFATRERIPSADELIVEWPAGGDRAGAARPPDGDRRPHARRQVRRAGAHRRARDGGVLHRCARLASQPGAPSRAAARGGRRGVVARADHGAVRPRRRRRHAGGDRALDPRGDPRRARTSARAAS